MEKNARGEYNIVDDEPVPARECLPYLASCAGGKRPLRVTKWLARLLAGEGKQAWHKFEEETRKTALRQSCKDNGVSTVP